MKSAPDLSEGLYVLEQVGNWDTVIHVLGSEIKRAEEGEPATEGNILISQSLTGERQ